MRTISPEHPRSIATLRDPGGVLSVYVTVDPHEEAGESPTWQVKARTEWDALLHHLGTGGDDHRFASLHDRLTTLAPLVDRLVDPTAPGQGRALFATLDRPEVRTVSMQLPLGTAVVVDESPYLFPLMAAHSSGAPAGVVAVTGHGVRMIEHRLGRADDLDSRPYRPPPADRELVGPANPRVGQRSVTHRDLHDRRAADHLIRFLADTGAHVGSVAVQRRWEHLLITGDAALVGALHGGLPTQVRARVTTAPHVVPTALSAARAEAMVAGELAEGRRRAQRRLAEQVRDTALGGGPGTYGPTETLAALPLGRVRHLLLDRGRRFYGRRSPDGRLWLGDERPPGVADDELSTEPDLGERMIEEAYRHGADVTLLEAEAAPPLADGDGVAALLRW